MSDNCTDSTNEYYKLYWFDYFVSIGYITDSDSVNPYAPYGKCTRSLLWLTYLINLIHFFLLSSGTLYILNHHRNRSGFWWPFITWMLSFIFIIASIILFIFRNLNTRLFPLLIIAVQLSTLIIQWISIFIVTIQAFHVEARYQRCLFIFIVVLLLLQAACFAAQALITLHCVFNLKFISTFLDYSYWSAIVAAACIIISTLLFDYIFIWCGKHKTSSRISPAPTAPLNLNPNRATSPIDPVILEDFHQQPGGADYQISSNSDRIRRFRIQPANQRLNNEDWNISANEHRTNPGHIHSLLTASEA
ncbi:unnamed protein product [Adineta ricciae]|uniref:Uncharacterized protein n=1 Tax=Adineta ricciae TaxID=249248 RepID=A0A815IGB0_ADIRI|nr:unnamed protein product [Adineta ricciae]